MIDEQGADSLVLGCMSMSFLDATPELEARLEVPVVNPAKGALKLAEALVGAGLRHSKRAYPLPPKMAAGDVLQASGLFIS